MKAGLDTFLLRNLVSEMQLVTIPIEIWTQRPRRGLLPLSSCILCEAGCVYHCDFPAVRTLKWYAVTLLHAQIAAFFMCWITILH